MINVAQFGCGYWGPNLLRNLESHDSFCVKYVVDPSLDRRAYISKHYSHIQTEQTVDEVLKDGDIQAVVIATPAHTHYELVMKCLEVGKHVLVEKPMATMDNEIENIQALAQSKKVTAMVGHTFLYNPAVRYLKQLIDTGDLGDVRYITCQRLNLGRIRSDVDALWNLAPHDVSIVQYLLNDQQPEMIQSQGMDFIQPNICDVSFLTLKYQKKILVNIHVSWLHPTKVRKIIVVGSKKMVVYDDVSDHKISIFDKGIDRMAVLGEGMDFDDPSTIKFSHRVGDINIPKIPNTEPLFNEIDHFSQCVQHGIPCLTGTQHAKSVVSILKKASEKNPMTGIGSFL